MALSDLGNVLKIFRGSEPTPEEQRALFKEVLLMTLARASSSDANINACEVDTVQKVLEEATGDSVSTADIRVAAASTLYESAPLEDYLVHCGGKLHTSDRVTILQALAQVIKSDQRMSHREITFFNGVARALEVTPAELVGLISDTP